VSLVIVVETFRVRNYAAFILESSCFPYEEIIYVVDETHLETLEETNALVSLSHDLS